MLPFYLEAEYKRTNIGVDLPSRCELVQGEAVQHAT